MRILMILAEWDETTPSSMAGWVVGSYYHLLDSGAEVVLASPEGGAPISSSSLSEVPSWSPRFRADNKARESFSDTLSLRQIFTEDFDAAYCVHLSLTSPKGGLDQIEGIVNRLNALGRPSALILGHPSTEVRIIGASPSEATAMLLKLAATC